MHVVPYDPRGRHFFVLKPSHISFPPASLFAMPLPSPTHLRRRAGGLAVRGLFEGASKLARLHPRADIARHGVRCVRDLAYTSSGLRAHTLDIYMPEEDGPHPVIFYVHGGGFRILSKDTHWIMGLIFARQGYVVVNINYRLAPEHRFPVAAQDTSEAWAWMVEHVERFGGDPQRVIVAGESAGANLISGLCISATQQREEPWARRIWETACTPKAALAYCGMLHVSQPERYRDAGISRFEYERITEVSQGYLGRTYSHHDLADVLVAFERGYTPQRPMPPFFLPVGSKDPIQEETHRMARALRAMGVDAQARTYEGGLHAFHAFVWTHQSKQCWEDTFDFLTHYGLHGSRMTPAWGHGAP